jgi:DNA (cytosine-5)-methyltransferase 1
MIFAGIGGFRIAMQRLQRRMWFSSEWDKMAQRTYYANFGEITVWDITRKEQKNGYLINLIFYAAVFHVNLFNSRSDQKKRLRQKTWIRDEKQGNLFFHIAEIIEKHRPRHSSRKCKKPYSS